MIDFHLRAFIEAMRDLNVARVKAQIPGQNEFPTDDQLCQLYEDLQNIALQADNLALPTVKFRIAAIKMLFGKGARTTNGALIYELYELSNAIEHDAVEEFFSITRARWRNSYAALMRNGKMSSPRFRPRARKLSMESTATRLATTPVAYSI
jgi:hypothetical protein